MCTLSLRQKGTMGTVQSFQYWPHFQHAIEKFPVKIQQIKRSFALLFHLETNRGRGNIN